MSRNFQNKGKLHWRQQMLLPMEVANNLQDKT